MQWKNQYYVFGGNSYDRQVSMVSGNRLERKATLDFDFDYGGCTVIKEQTIVLCFDSIENEVCRKSNYPWGSFTQLPNSNYGHGYTKIASFDGKNTFI